MKIMKKSYLILAAIASVALVSCSSEEYLGEFEGAIHGEKAISFNSEYGRVTRAELRPQPFLTSTLPSM